MFSKIDKKYHCLVVDPPWKVKAGRPLGSYVVKNGQQIFDQTHQKARDLSYPSMTVEEIKNIPIRLIAENNSHLYLWTINKYVRSAYDIAEAWGFTPSTLLTWAKTPFGGGLGGAFGISSEYLLFCRRGTLKAKTRIKGTWFHFKRPYDERGKPKHSAKPEQFQDMIEQVSPGPYIELFARRKREGWDVWGNELK